MLEVMGTLNVTWDELDILWPWSRVLDAYDSVVRQRYYHSYPIAYLHATYLGANLKKGKKVPNPHQLMLPQAIPPEVLKASLVEAPYSLSIVNAFSAARSLGFTSNAHLAAFGTDELRASGWSPGR